MATDFVLMNRRTFGIRTAAFCFAAGMMVSPFSLAAEEPLLKIGVLPAADSVLLYAAESEGFFESRGLRIQLLPFKSAIEIGAAMRAGELAGHYGDLINVFTQNAAGAPQAVAATVTYANPAERNFALVTRPGSNLTSLEDIKTHPGTDTAMSASTIIDYLLDRMEATTGLPPSDFNRGGGPPSARHETRRSSADSHSSPAAPRGQNGNGAVARAPLQPGGIEGRQSTLG